MESIPRGVNLSPRPRGISFYRPGQKLIPRLRGVSFTTRGIKSTGIVESISKAQNPKSNNQYGHAQPMVNFI